ncbi:hypothetical protein AK812_SmicGene3798 [Symbiodinium microadriaticum]|uniref:Uncharacterized protein n=1 Tax=Symbiodinium microadriaticum TaxID=2951 RepID=A0A1Q9EY58_SYMMI|nr:hypothetical protein AK812_SmicGene3798 [Symbiodinium microadriaticum]
MRNLPDLRDPQRKEKKARKAVDAKKMAGHAGARGKQEHMPDFRINPEYQPTKNVIRQRVVATVITVITLLPGWSVEGLWLSG